MTWQFSGTTSGRCTVSRAFDVLLAVLPFYLPMVVPLDLRFLRALRLIRILRLLKLGRYSQAMQTIARVVVAKKEELLVTAFVEEVRKRRSGSRVCPNCGHDVPAT